MRKIGKRLDGRDRNHSNPAQELQRAAECIQDWERLKDAHEHEANKKISEAIDIYSILIGDLTVAVGGGGIGNNQNADADLVKAHFCRASAFMNIGRYNSALTDLYQTLNNNPEPKHYKLLARCNQELKNITEALQNYHDALEIATNNHQKAEIFLEKG